VVGAVVMPGAVGRSGVEVFRDPAVRLFLSVIGTAWASALTIESRKARVVRLTPPATDQGWSMVYPSATYTSGKADAEQQAGETLSGREKAQGRSFSGGVLIGYARCSTDKQDLSAQRVTLRQLGVSEDRVYLDHGLTGRNRNRPGLQQALAAVREGDTLVVPKLDRLARSVPDARAIGDSLAARGVRLSVAGTVYDPHDPMGKMFFNILATFAEFEVDLLRMRTREGMAIARANGKLPGKSPKLNARQRVHVLKLYEAGEHTIADLAALFSVSRATVYREVLRARHDRI
jgi:DNA invertase Pin-like site-specific DNA recombinase